MKKNLTTTVLVFVAIIAMIGLFSLKPTKLKVAAPTTKDQANQEVTAQTQESESISAQAINLQISPDGKTVSYNGKTSLTAYNLLEAVTQVEKEDTAFGPMVKAINNVKATDKEFWTYTVDGKMASVGAHQYQTKDGEKIEWRLSSM